jgi:hypothetical protein
VKIEGLDEIFIQLILFLLFSKISIAFGFIDIKYQLIFSGFSSRSFIALGFLDKHSHSILS